MMIKNIAIVISIVLLLSITGCSSEEHGLGELGPTCLEDSNCEEGEVCSDEGECVNDCAQSNDNICADLLVGDEVDSCDSCNTCICNEDSEGNMYALCTEVGCGEVVEEEEKIAEEEFTNELEITEEEEHTDELENVICDQSFDITLDMIVQYEEKDVS